MDCVITYDAHLILDFILLLLQADGDKRIELKPGFLMEHDKEVGLNQFSKSILQRELILIDLWLIYALWNLQLNIQKANCFS